MYYYIKGLALFSPVNFLSKQERAIIHGGKKSRSQKLRRNLARFVDLNKCFASFPGGDLADKIDVTELDDIFINTMTNIWSKQAYVQGFDWKYILFKKPVNMFDRM